MSKINALKFGKIKELIHPILIKVLTSKTTNEITVNGKFPEDDNYLIVANHICIEDIPTLGQAVNDHFYLLVSDEDKPTIDGLGLSLNGVEWVHRTDKESRVQSSKNLVTMLQKGKNVAMYPEATWNLSPNQLIMQMNYGCIRMALEAKKNIIPVVTLFTKENRYTTIGEEFIPTNDLAESISNLRDQMSSMVYEMIQEDYRNRYSTDGNIFCMMVDGEKYYYERRSSISDSYWDEYVDQKYEAYKRARIDKTGVREFESQFIFTPNDDKYEFFQEFNSLIQNKNGQEVVKRISSEKNGYSNSSFGEQIEKTSFGYGYNEKTLKRSLKK